MQNEIMVSINCITYNHEAYIADAIESFLMQKTNFKYEILIHDDASTDNTAQIIREYEDKYPDLIKPIYQKENQYSKGVKVGLLNEERAKGKYIALCEGDDFWTDPYKLQKQVDYMENHPECSVCVHTAKVINAETKITTGNIRPCSHNRTFNVEDVIEGGGGFVATNSMLYRTASMTELPEFYYIAPVGDYPMMIYLALKGTVYYIDEFMSVYREGVKGSWSQRSLSDNNLVLKTHIGLNKMLDEINEYTNYKYKKTINNTAMQHKYNVLSLQRNYKEARSGEYGVFYKEINTKYKFYLFLKYRCPKLVSIINRARRKIVCSFSG